MHKIDKLNCADMSTYQNHRNDTAHVASCRHCRFFQIPKFREWVVQAHFLRFSIWNITSRGCVLSFPTCHCCCCIWQYVYAGLLPLTLNNLLGNVVAPVIQWHCFVAHWIYECSVRAINLMNENVIRYTQRNDSEWNRVTKREASNFA